MRQIINKEEMKEMAQDARRGELRTWCRTGNYESIYLKSQISVFRSSNTPAHALGESSMRQK